MSQHDLHPSNSAFSAIDKEGVGFGLEIVVLHNQVAQLLIEECQIRFYRIPKGLLDAHFSGP